MGPQGHGQPHSIIICKHWPTQVLHKHSITINCSAKIITNFDTPKLWTHNNHNAGCFEGHTLLMILITELQQFNVILLIIRVFGEEVSSLKVLSVTSCGISELHGIDFLVNLKELYASDNLINNVLDLSDLHHLTILDLEE